MPFTLPDLPYSFDALEPYIDAKTMEIHHDKHHAAYVANLNKAIEANPDLAEKSLEELLLNAETYPETLKMQIKNNGGGHFNHSFFWPLMQKNGGGEPVGSLLDAIKKTWGTTSSFKDEFSKAALGRFGSGWGWLSVDKNSNLVIHSTQNQNCPVMDGLIPVLAIDVWEHAYYLNYQNRRADYIAAWWNVVNWNQAESNYLQAIK